MTAYLFTHATKTLLPSTDVQGKKAARKKLLEAVFARRREIYTRRYKKLRVQTDSHLL